MSSLTPYRLCHCHSLRRCRGRSSYQIAQSSRVHSQGSAQVVVVCSQYSVKHSHAIVWEGAWHSVTNMKFWYKYDTNEYSWRKIFEYIRIGVCSTWTQSSISYNSHNHTIIIHRVVGMYTIIMKAQFHNFTNSQFTQCHRLLKLHLLYMSCV